MDFLSKTNIFAEEWIQLILLRDLSGPWVCRKKKFSLFLGIINNKLESVLNEVFSQFTDVLDVIFSDTTVSES